MNSLKKPGRTFATAIALVVEADRVFGLAPMEEPQ